MNVLGLIPARGGSKGVRRKNVRALAGIPLIAHSIKAALSCSQLDAVVVTTDDNEIAEIAKNLGATIVIRDEELSGDATPMPPVAVHALDTLDKEHTRFDTLVLLQPTCPFREASDIDKALKLLQESSADAVIGVYRVEDAHPARMYTSEDGLLKALYPEWENANRQDLPNIYHRNGAIYGIRRNVLEREQSFFAGRCIPYIMPEDRSVNIDTEFDFRLAEFIAEDRGFSTATS